MFERFTSSARECVANAQEEAAALRHGHIGTEHLLIALAGDRAGLGGQILRAFGVSQDELRAALPSGGAPPGIDADALASIGIDLDEVRRRAEETFGPGALDTGRRRPRQEGGYAPFTPKSKKALELALRSAVHLHDDFIGSEHLLLGIARVEEDTGAKLLKARGITRDRLEAAIKDARRAA
jgi:ATP-dependent Clp protease ATP-binding subunit ClpA